MGNTPLISMQKNKNIGKIISSLILVSLIGILSWQIFVFSGIDNIIKSTNSAFDNSGLNFGSLFSGKVELKGQNEGRTNILLFGYNEFDGDGMGTVDSNIIMSYFHDKKKISTISIMRDLVVDNGVKINAIYPEIGDSKTQNKEYQDYMSKLTAIPIHYTLKVNMKAALELVDKIGGIEVDVPITFKDNEFPKFNDYSTAYCPERQSYDPYICPAPLFEKGLNKLDGERALTYARSRKGVCLGLNKTWYDVGCTENGDDARGRRQQQVIQGIAQKLKNDVESKKIVFNPQYLQGLLEVLGNNVQASMNVAEVVTLMTTIRESVDIKEIKKITLSYQSTVYKKDSLLLCTSGESDVLLCDNSTFSANNKGNYALRLREIFYNPLEEVDINIIDTIDTKTKPKPITQ
jgi:anionic cell wall polymer biosynthesis LytR-Cps2A-Psr (LCP) family protein